MKIVADKNIPCIHEAYSEFGEVITLSGREFNHDIVAGADAVLVRSITPVTEKLLANSSVRFVATATIGIEHIDRTYLDKKGIGFAYAPGSNADSVAEYVIAAILLMAKKSGRSPADMVLGIIGVGNVGSRVHARAKAIGMQCLLNDPPKQRLLKPGKIDQFKSIEKVLAGSDIVTVHVPLETRGSDPTVNLINDRFFMMMKPGAVLFNTSRGRIMNDANLKKHHTRLDGLVLDVWNNEPCIDPSIVELADVATPHIAGYSFNGKINGAAMIYQAFCEYFNVPSRWDHKRILREERGQVIDCSGAENPVYCAVLKAVPIVRDSNSLKNIISLPDNEQGVYFDSLRANYPKRLECAHYSVQCDTSNAGSTSILKNLGFTLEKT